MQANLSRLAFCLTALGLSVYTFTRVPDSIACWQDRTGWCYHQCASVGVCQEPKSALQLPSVSPALRQSKLSAHNVQVASLEAAKAKRGNETGSVRAMLLRKVTIPASLRKKASMEKQTLDFGGDLRTGDLTGDGEVEFLVYRSDSKSRMKPCFLGAFNLKGQVLWQAGGGGTQPRRPGPVALYDLDGDGCDEVLCFFLDRSREAPRDSLSNVLVQIRDGKTGQVKKEAAPAAVTERKGWGPNWCHQRLLIANLRGLDRPKDFVVKLGDTLVAFNGELKVLWTYKIKWNRYGHCTAYIPAVGDMNGDGHDEVNGGYYLLNSKGQPLWEKMARSGRYQASPARRS